MREASRAEEEDVTGAIETVHRFNIIHRDTKPANIHVGADATAHLLDLVAGKFFGQIRPTTAGFQLGTVPYMSPEQIRSQPLDPRSDVYAATVVLYEIVTGVHPFSVDGTIPGVFALCARILREPHLPPGEVAPWLPDFVAQILDKGMSKDPAQRFRSAGELAMVLAAALRALVSGLLDKRAIRDPEDRERAAEALAGEFEATMRRLASDRGEPDPLVASAVRPALEPVAGEALVPLGTVPMLMPLPASGPSWRDAAVRAQREALSRAATEELPAVTADAPALSEPVPSRTGGPPAASEPAMGRPVVVAPTRARAGGTAPVPGPARGRARGMVIAFSAALFIFVAGVAGGYRFLVPAERDRGRDLPTASPVTASAAAAWSSTPRRRTALRLRLLLLYAFRWL